MFPSVGQDVRTTHTSAPDLPTPQSRCYEASLLRPLRDRESHFDLQVKGPASATRVDTKVAKGLSLMGHGSVSVHLGLGRSSRSLEFSMTLIVKGKVSLPEEPPKNTEDDYHFDSETTDNCVWTVSVRSVRRVLSPRRGRLGADPDVSCPLECPGRRCGVSRGRRPKRAIRRSCLTLSTTNKARQRLRRASLLKDDVILRGRTLGTPPAVQPWKSRKLGGLAN